MVLFVSSLTPAYILLYVFSPLLIAQRTPNLTYALSSVFPFARECGRVTKLRPTGCIEKFCTVRDEQERILKKRDLILLSVSFLPSSRLEFRWHGWYRAVTVGHEVVSRGYLSSSAPHQSNSSYLYQNGPLSEVTDSPASPKKGIVSMAILLSLGTRFLNHLLREVSTTNGTSKQL